MSGRKGLLRPGGTANRGRTWCQYTVALDEPGCQSTPIRSAGNGAWVLLGKPGGPAWCRSGFNVVFSLQDTRPNDPRVWHDKLCRALRVQRHRLRGPPRDSGARCTPVDVSSQDGVLALKSAAHSFSAT